MFWAWLAPCNNESADKKKSVRITRAGVYLKQFETLGTVRDGSKSTQAKNVYEKGYLLKNGRLALR
jgi:hypothetical protein